MSAVLGGLTMTHLLLADLLTDKAIMLIKASRPENLRTLTKEQADALIKELRPTRDALVQRLKEHGAVE
jgi:hypothetical protein